MLPLVLMVLALTDFGNSATLDDCPAGIPRNGYLTVYGDICYRFVLNKRVTRHAAMRDCKQHGGLLALVQTPEIQNYIYGRLINRFNFKVQVWIGLRAKWTWADGDEMTYYNWNAGEGPNYDRLTNGYQDVAVLDGQANGVWRDFSDMQGNVFNFVCQYPAKTI